MKFIAVILSFYLMVLTAIPCIDAPADNALHKTELTHQKQDNHTVPHSDHCSPFCSCNCCATSAIFVEYSVSINCFSFSETQYFPLTSEFYSDSSSAIWQPPKIA